MPQLHGDPRGEALHPQDVNTEYMFNDVTLYNQRVMGPAHVVNVTDYACRTALAQRGPAHLAFPIDFQAAPADSGTRFTRNVAGHTSTAFRPPVQVPQRQDLDAAARILSGRTKVAILAGAGARGAGEELEAIADKLAVPIIKAMLGKDCVPDDSPYTTGPIGLVGSRPSEEDEASFDAGPVRIIPGKIGQAASGIIGRLRDHAQGEHPE